MRLLPEYESNTQQKEENMYRLLDENEDLNTSYIHKLDIMTKIILYSGLWIHVYVEIIVVKQTSFQ
jgi:hypothetical protein